MIIPSKKTSFSDFVCSVVNDFTKDNIPIFTDEKDWKKFGNFLIQENSFVENGAPSPHGFKTRTEWEQAVYQSMSSYS